MEKSKEQQCRNEDKKDDHLKRGRPRKNKKITNGESVEDIMFFNKFM